MRRATFPVDGRLELVGFGFVEDELDDGLDLLALLLPHRRVRRQLHRREHQLYITPHIISTPRDDARPHSPSPSFRSALPLAGCFWTESSRREPFC